MPKKDKLVIEFRYPDKKTREAILRAIRDLKFFTDWRILKDTGAE